MFDITQSITIYNLKLHFYKNIPKEKHSLVFKIIIMSMICLNFILKIKIASNHVKS